MLHPVGKQVYKLELPKTWKISDIFYVLLLEQNTIKKGRVDEKVRQMEFDADNNSRKYKMEAFWDSTIYTKELESNHLPGIYHLVFWKRYLKEENTWELALAVQHFRKLVSLFYKNHPNKPIATSPIFDTTPPMARLIAKPTKSLKRK